MNCDKCGRSFTVRSNLERHKKTHEKSRRYSCRTCNKTFKKNCDKTYHENNCRQNGNSNLVLPEARKEVTGNGFRVEKVDSAFKNANITWKLIYGKNNGADYISIINSSCSTMSSKLEGYRKENHALKFNMSIHVKFEQSTDPSIVTNPPVVLVSEQFEVYLHTDIPELLNIIAKQLENRIETYEGTGSGWVIANLVSLDTTIWQLDPLRASSYHALPKWIQNTSCVLNIKNNDQFCFKYAVLAGLYLPKLNRRKCSTFSYPYANTMEDTPEDFSMLTFPVPLREISKFEKVNNISVNVYGIDTCKSLKKTTQGKKIKSKRILKRKRQRSDIHSMMKSKKLRRSNFIDDEAECSDDENDEHDEGNDDVHDFIDDGKEIEDSISTYHRIDNDIDKKQSTSLVEEQTHESTIVSDNKDEKNDRHMIYPLRVTDKELHRHVNLLLTELDGVWHYSTIKNFSGFIRAQYSKHNGSRTFYCYSCLHGFQGKKGETSRKKCSRLQEHVKYCKTQKPQKVSYPENKTLKFENIHKQLKHPFVGYADFECTLQRTTDKNVSTGICDDSDHSKEFSYQNHIDASYFTKFVSIDSEFKLDENEFFKFPQTETYTGNNAAEHFIDYVQTVAEKIFQKYIQNPKPMIFTKDDEENQEKSTHCHICKNEFISTDIIVRDHCHITGEYRGAAHQNCNLKYRINSKSWKLPIFFHNLRGYDGHLLIKAVKKRHGMIRVIPNNMQKYLAISIGRVQFLDSFQFTMKPLDKLVSTIDDKDYIHTKKIFSDEEEFNLIKQKGVFPYDYFDSLEKLHQKSYPTKEQFFNTLSNKECTLEDYLRGKTIWDKFNCKTLKDYHDLYLKCDVLLLTDFFEKFRTECLESYGVDAAHYFSAPGMAWDSAFKLTKVELDLLDNEEMYTFFERSIRGGVSQISKRFAKANNPSCQNFDPSSPLSFLIYLDANNLYGWAMSQYLPTRNFRWLSLEEINNLDIHSLNVLAKFGYIFEVDLEYPATLHYSHSDYPLAPEKLTITESMLSNFQQKFPKNQKRQSEKLTPNLYDKQNYVVHARNLLFYLKQGLIIKKIHRVLTFEQSPWLKKYIDFNTEKRSQSSSLFAKDFYKLMNNSVYGKTTENLRNRVNVEVINRRDIALKRVCKPSFKRSMHLHEDLVIIQSLVSNLELNKPIYIGFSVLELSKLLMYKFHYEKMLKRYKDINLCFTDTDSLLYEVFTNDIYRDMLSDQNDYDFSDYPPNHFLYSNKNKKKIGKFKDELNGVILEEFIGLRAKCYSLLYQTIDESGQLIRLEKHTAKGTKESVKKASLRHEHYMKCITNLDVIRVKQNAIVSKNHELKTYHQNRVSLTAFDTKRWICENGINTLAYGHIDTSN